MAAPNQPAPHLTRNSVADRIGNAYLRRLLMDIADHLTILRNIEFEGRQITDDEDLARIAARCGEASSRVLHYVRAQHLK